MFNLSKLVNSLYFLRQNFISFFSKFFSYLYIKIYLIILLIINILIWLTAHFIDVRIDEELIALHYNVDFGINLIGGVEKIYIIPLLGLAIILINFILSASVNRSRDGIFISHILFITAMMVNLVLLVAIVSIYLINFY